jgi:predicted type IV restriction endonuclease
MSLENHIPDIQKKLKNMEYTNEQSISQGIVSRLLSTLDWPVYDTQLVIPEYNIQGRRVDFALCAHKNKPVIFVEVKQPGNTLGADKQLFEYAFHTGVPFAIVTDGKEWHFYLQQKLEVTMNVGYINWI